MNIYKTDFLVIGTGLAGLYSAFYASKFGTVTLLTKHTLETSSSYWAQGGIAAAIDPNDSTEFHFNDTLTAGRGLCDNEAVKILVNEGKERILELIEEGMKFDSLDGEITLGLEGGHSKRRVLHAGGDATGKQIVDFLIDKVKSTKNISVFDNTLVYQLITENNKCIGAKAHRWYQKENLIFNSKSVILASGGASGIYLRTTNPHSSTGDGIGLAFQAGTEIRDLEFIQFHPTAFYSSTGKTFLISEAVRGEGAYLVNHDGNRFMIDQHELAELAPRDVVSKAIFEEMKKNSVENVFLKLDHLDPEKIRNRFSNIYKEAIKFGIDITKDLIPIAPAAHYMVGGIKTDLNGETNVKNLFACGEVASTGVHGANRLASNSLLECMVFGKRSVDKSLDSLNSNFENISVRENDFFVDKNLDEKYLKLKNEIADVMTKYVGIVRDKSMLIKAIELINNIDADWNYEMNEYFSNRLASLKQVSLLIANAALNREESRGGHIRLDFQSESENRFHTIQQINKDLSFENA